MSNPNDLVAAKYPLAPNRLDSIRIGNWKPEYAESDLASMSDHSSIEWTDATWNPIRGCTKISPGWLTAMRKHLPSDSEAFPGIPMNKASTCGSYRKSWLIRCAGGCRGWCSSTR